MIHRGLTAPYPKGIDHVLRIKTKAKSQKEERKLDLFTSFIDLSAHYYDLLVQAHDLSTSELDLSARYKKIDKTP